MTNTYQASIIFYIKKKGLITLRGKQNIDTIDEQISKIDEKIEKTQERIRGLKSSRQELLEKKESLAMQEVYNILAEKGMSAQQAADILRNA